ncbi:MAG: hypothetical protein P9M14_07870 [Candidatus Alcyoniella australis]|nr:hypothetical protein [Candidatus Alcyoniella australis]
MSSNGNIGFVPGIALIMSAVALLLILLGHVGDIGTDDLQVEVNALTTDFKVFSEKMQAVPERLAALEDWKTTELNGNALDKAKLYLGEYIAQHPADVVAGDALKVLNGELLLNEPEPEAVEEDAQPEEQPVE